MVIKGNLIWFEAQWGGANYYGDIYTVNTDGTGYKDWFDFNNVGTSGIFPLDNLVFAGNTGYGTTNFGGTYDDGTIFSYKFPCTTVALSVQNISCKNGNNGSATVTVLGGNVPPYTYSWAPSGGTDSTASPLSLGTYTVTVTNHDGCSVTTAFTITEPLVPLSVVGNVVSQIPCHGDGNVGKASATVIGSTAPLTYSWAPSGGSSDTASNLSIGTYTVTVKDACGSSKTASVTITQPATSLSISINSETDPTCNGGLGSAKANAATGGTQFFGNNPNIYPFAGTGLGGYNGDGIPATSADLNEPEAITTDASGNLYVAEQANNRIRKVDLFGIITTVGGNGIGGFSGRWQGLLFQARISAPQGVCYRCFRQHLHCRSRQQ